MKRRSITSFVLALLAGLTIFLFGSIFAVIFSLFAGLSEGITRIFVNVHLLSIYLLYIGAALAIIGSAFCFSMSRVGGILLIVASCFLILFPILNTILVVMNFSMESIFLLLFTYIPAVLVIIGAVLAMKGELFSN